MNPAVNRATRGLGASFKGVAAYLLNPKPECDGVEASPHRLGFTACRNTGSDDPDQAWRIMAMTAMRRDELKLAAGGSTAGRKPKDGEFRPVFHYSLGWHPDQTPDQAAMLKAADASIAALGLEKHQALIVQHIDEAHAHLHIVVNRVDPETGKLHCLSHNWNKLDRWAAQYERETGQIVSPDREAKYKALEQGQEPTQGRKWLPHEEWTQAQRSAHELRQQAANDDRPPQGRQAAERDSLWESQQAARRALLEEAKIAAREQAQQLREQQRPAWTELGREQAAQRRELAKAIGTESGRIGFLNAHREYLHQAFDDDATRRAEWASLLIPEGLKDGLARAQAVQSAELRRDVQHERHAMQQEFWSDYRDQVSDLRREQTAEREALREQQRARSEERTTQTQIEQPTVAAMPPQSRFATEPAKVAMPAPSPSPLTPDTPHVRSRAPNRYVELEQPAATGSGGGGGRSAGDELAAKIKADAERIAVERAAREADREQRRERGRDWDW